jgi:hypothetical protein
MASMSGEIPIFSKVVKRARRIYKHKELMPILNCLSQAEIPRGEVAAVHHDTGIPYCTLRDRHDMRNRPSQANWFPPNDGHLAADMFDDDAEAFVIDCFKTNYIQLGFEGTRQALDSLCLNSYSSTRPDEFKRDRFCPSSPFLHGLEKRHGLTMRRSHAERRTEINEAYARYFCDRTNALCEGYPPELVFNLDEICWRLFKAPRWTLEEKGKETVKLRSHTSQETSLAAFGGITCNGDKLPLWVVAKGKTTQMKVKFDPHPGIIMRHTEN